MLNIRFAPGLVKRCAITATFLIGAAPMSVAFADEGDVTIDALAKSHCSKQQVFDQIQKMNPLAWGFVSGQPDAMNLLNAVVDDFIGKSPEARRSALNNLKGDFPGTYNELFNSGSGIGASVTDALSTCE